jgi:release factor glutamine methyltransferase
MLDDNQRKRVEYVLTELDMPTYDTDAFKDVGIGTLRVFSGVLPPDRTITSPAFARFLKTNKALFQNKRVLELGSGSGILSVVMAMHGAQHIVATDIMDACVENTRLNAEILHLDHVIETRKGDLFEPIKDERFDLIVFAHPIYCDEPAEGSGLATAIMDSGGLIRRFLGDAKTYLKPNARLLLPFNEAAGEGNHPQTHAEKYGFDIDRLASLDEETGDLFVYELSPK